MSVLARIAWAQARSRDAFWGSPRTLDAVKPSARPDNRNNNNNNNDDAADDDNDGHASPESLFITSESQLRHRKMRQAVKAEQYSTVNDKMTIAEKEQAGNGDETEEFQGMGLCFWDQLAVWIFGTRQASASK